MTLPRWVVVLSVFPLLFATHLFATDWPPVTPEELKMTSEPLAPGAPAVILYREQTDDDINNVHRTYVRMKILREAGRDIADVGIVYSRRWFTVGDINGRTVHPDGSIIPFTVKPFDKALIRGHGVRINVKTFTLPDVQVGSIIDYEYAVRMGAFSGVYFGISDPIWIIQENLFQEKAVFKYTPISEASMTRLENRRNGHPVRGVAWTAYLPSNLPQPKTHEVRGHVVSVDVDRRMPSQYIDLALTNIPPLPTEPEMPPPDLLRWRVAFYVVTESSKEDFWKAEAKMWDKDTKEFVGHDGGVRDVVSQTIGAADSAEQKVKKLYAFVTNLENWDYVPERSEKEKKELNIKKDDNAGEVLKNKGGNHSDLNRLFVSMVRAAGLPAYVMWVPDRSEQLFDDNFLSTRQLDSEIAVVQIDDKEIFLDPGSKFCPYGLLDWRYSGVRGLRQTANGAEIGQTPPINYNQSITTRSANLLLTSDGSARGKVMLTFMGLEGMKRRQQGGLTDDIGRKKLLEDELRGMLPANSDISLSKPPDWTNSALPLSAEFNISLPLAANAGKRLLLTQHVFQVNSAAKFVEAQRLYPVYFDYPWREVDETHIALPAGMEVENPAPDSASRLEYATYKSQHKLEAAGKVYARREFVMASEGIPAANYNEVKTFFNNVKAGDDQTALMRMTQNVAATK